MTNFTLTYKIENRLYINVTNRCTNDCVFCIRKSKQGVGYNLWLTREPNADEIINSLGDLKPYSEIVFCGYGEPLLRLDLVTELAKHIKKESGKIIRINTNGHADLINGKDSAAYLHGLVDKINISLNAQNCVKYLEICRPRLGSRAYEAVIQFAASCKGLIPNVVLSVVEWPGVDTEKCRAITKNLGVGFLLRRYSY